jgi:hypothetical protein
MRWFVMHRKILWFLVIYKYHTGALEPVPRYTRDNASHWIAELPLVAHNGGEVL